MTNEKEKQYREEFEATNWEMETDFIDVYLAACKKREEEINLCAEINLKLDTAKSEIVQLKIDKASLQKRLEETEKELYQQRFNNKHNLSIDQKVSDEIASLKKELEDVKATDHYKKNQFWKNAHANIQKDNNEIFRRMELLESLLQQAVPWVENYELFISDSAPDKDLLEIEQWLKTSGSGEMRDECQYCMFYGREINKLEAEISNLRAELEAERAVVDFYANKENYYSTSTSKVRYVWIKNDVEEMNGGKMGVAGRRARERQAQRSGK